MEPPLATVRLAWPVVADAEFIVDDELRTGAADGHRAAADGQRTDVGVGGFYFAAAENVLGAAAGVADHEARGHQPLRADAGDGDRADRVCPEAEVADSELSCAPAPTVRVPAPRWPTEIWLSAFPARRDPDGRRAVLPASVPMKVRLLAIAPRR